VGDIHVDAAKLALETANISVRPHDRLNSVITHLEAAHAAYASIHNQTGFIREVKDGFDHGSIWNACNRDIWVCAVMALCYASLGERRAMLKSLALAEKAFENREFKSNIPDHAQVLLLPIAVLGVLNPRNWNNDNQLISKEQFAKFRTAIQDAA
jgi:hypothetical protein